MIGTPKINSNTLMRGLPKTGQTAVYVAGDDGTYQAGWWRGRTNANNRPRFISKTIGGDEIVIDRATGLWWSKYSNSSINNDSSALTWSNAVAFPIGKSFAGKSDWRLSNVLEMLSIVNHANSIGMYYPDFFINPSFYYWTSTTSPSNAANASAILGVSGLIYVRAKTSSLNIFCCRGGV